MAALLPVPFGSMEEWAIFAFEASSAILLIAFLVGVREDGIGGSGIDKAFPGFLKILLAAFFILSSVMIVPLPDSIVAALSPQAASFQRGLTELGLAPGGRVSIALSLAPAVSLHFLAKYAAYAVFAFLVYCSVRTRKEAEIFLLVLAAAAVFEAAYGAAQVFGGTERIFSYQKKWSLGSLTGTYINRNHLAGFLEMVFPLILGYLLAKADFFSMGRRGGLKERLLWFGQEKLQKTLVIGIIASIVGLGLIFSRSRTGVLIFLVTVFLMLIALAASRTAGREGGLDQSGRRGGRLVRMVGLAVVFTAVVIGLRPVVERFTKEKVTIEAGRPAYFKNSLKMIRDFPLTGTGAGAFVYAYQKYEEKDSRALVNHAHNDYLEVFAEHGIPAGVALWVFLFGIFGVGWARWAKRRDPFVRGVGLGCLGGIAAIFIHSLADFNLQITANAAIFCALLALLLRVTSFESEKKAIGDRGAIR